MSRPDHGYLLLPVHMDYSDLESPGTVTIQIVNHELEIHVANFKWGELGSCREQVTKAMCWARDILKAAIENDRLTPGGNIHVIEASDGEEEE